MIKIFLYVLLFFSAFKLFISCAQISPPTGGPRDTIPPIRLSEIPINKSTNFKGRTITMEYNERIKVDKIKEQLIITPLIEFDYEFFIKKNTFKITFEESFQDSVTYTLNFRESIQDITENNPTKDNKFTFSTGNFIDSMSIEGYVKDHLTYDTLENILVGIYKAEDTITIKNGSPYYFTEINEDGFYRIENIKNGKYLLYAFIDENKNLKLETNKEAYGFIRDTLNLDSGNYIQNLDVIHLDLTEFKMNSTVLSGKNFDINFNKYIVDYTIKPIDTTYTTYTSLAKENKSVRFYNSFQGIDSIPVSFTAIDSISTQISDTVYIKFSDSKRKQDDLSIKILPLNNTPIDQLLKVEIAFNKPITKINMDSVFIQYDTTKILTIPDTVFHWNKHKDKLNFTVTIDKSLADTVINRSKRMAQQLRDSLANNEDENPVKKQMTKDKKETSKKINKGLQLYVGAGTFTSVENDTSVTVTSNYKFIVPEENGSQIINITTSYQNFTVQLLTEKFELYREISNTQNIEFNNIPPGKYKIRVFIDANNDGKWSPGNMNERIEPEPVYIYPKVLVIRADWKTTLDLTF